MERNAQGDKVFGDAAEAVASLRTWTLDVVRTLHRWREQGFMPLQEFNATRSRLNDIANVGSRWIEDRERRLPNPCPHCGRTVNEG